MNELNIYQLIGEIIENCQCIEHDLKIIYAIATLIVPIACESRLLIL